MAIDTAHDDHHQEQAPDSIPTRTENLCPTEPLAFRQVLNTGNHIDANHQHSTSQNTGYNPGKEHPAYRNISRRGVNHHHNGGRDQDTKGASHSNDTGSEVFGIANLVHTGDNNRANRDHGRRRRAGKRRKHHTGKHTRDGKATAKVAHQSNGKPDYAFCHPAGTHKAGSEDEKRNRQQRIVGIHCLKHGLANRGQRGIRVEQLEHDRAEAKRNGDRHTEQQKADDHTEEDDDFHGLSLLGGLGSHFFNVIFSFVAHNQGIARALCQSHKRLH